MHSAELRRCLNDCDVIAIRKLWAHVSPHLPQPESDGEALVAIHLARTQAGSIAFKKRAYSHRWLTDNGYPSGLPDNLKPKAERIYPRVVGGVGIATRTRTPVANAVREAMEYVVNDCYADGETRREILRPRMLEARLKVLKSA